MSQEVAQLNVRLPRTLKQQGDATLALMGSSPAKIIRQLWTRLAEGGDSYERIARALFEGDTAKDAVHEAELSPLVRATSLFENLGMSMGLDIASFEPSTKSEDDLLEEIEWDRLSERGLI